MEPWEEQTIQPQKCLPFADNSCLILPKAAGRLGKNIRPHLERIASNFAVCSGKSIFSPSLSLNSIIPFKPSGVALVLAICRILREMSVVTTLPFGMTIFAAVTAGSPMPVAISKTLSPGWISANCIILSLNFWAPRSMVSHQACQPAAALSLIWRCCALNSSELEDCPPLLLTSGKDTYELFFDNIRVHTSHHLCVRNSE